MVNKVVGAAGNRTKCDYRCDGVNDQVEILAAAATINDGGTVYLTSGVFNIGASFTLPLNVNLIGKGKSTILNFGSTPRVITCEGGSSFTLMEEAKEPALLIPRDEKLFGTPFGTPEPLAASFTTSIKKGVAPVNVVFTSNSTGVKLMHRDIIPIGNFNPVFIQNLIDATYPDLFSFTVVTPQEGVNWEMAYYDADEIPFPKIPGAICLSFYEDPEFHWASGGRGTSANGGRSSVPVHTADNTSGSIVNTFTRFLHELMHSIAGIPSADNMRTDLSYRGWLSHLTPTSYRTAFLANPDTVPLTIEMHVDWHEYLYQTYMMGPYDNGQTTYTWDIGTLHAVRTTPELIYYGIGTGIHNVTLNVSNHAGSDTSTETYPLTIVMGDVIGRQSIKELTIVGAGKLKLVGSAIRVSRVTSYATGSFDAAFSVEPPGVAYAIRFDQCDAIDTDMTGFMVNGVENLAITNITFSNCQAIRCGHAATRYIPGGATSCMVCGFEFKGGNITGGTVIECYADKCWEAGFRTDPARKMATFRFIRTFATNNGNAKYIADPTHCTYIAGFNIYGGCTCSECISMGNEYGFLMGNCTNSSSSRYGKNPQLYRSTEIGSKQYAYYSVDYGSSLTMNRCTTKDTLGQTIHAHNHTDLRVEGFQRLNAGGTVSFTGTDTTNVTYDDTGGA